jgi:hypothetical protein
MISEVVNVCVALEKIKKWVMILNITVSRYRRETIKINKFH